MLCPCLATLGAARAFLFEVRFPNELVWSGKGKPVTDSILYLQKMGGLLRKPQFVMWFASFLPGGCRKSTGSWVK
jgi:hypothetical protein